MKSTIDAEQVSADGIFSWTCAHCGMRQQAHVSHPEMAADMLDGTCVHVPTCTDCGAQKTIKVAYSDDELAPAVIRHDSTGRIVQVEVSGPPNLVTMAAQHGRARDGRRVIHTISEVGWHPLLAVYLEVARQMAAAGKLDPAHVRPGGLPEHVHIRPLSSPQPQQQPDQQQT